MQVDLDDFRRRYTELSDEALLELDRDELVDLARDCYDAELARRYAGRVDVVVALQEGNASFTASTMAKWLAAVPVYDQGSSEGLASTCGVSAIPAACLLEGNRAVWSGDPLDGAAVIDAYLAGTLDDVLAKMRKGDELCRDAGAHPEKRPLALAALRGFAGRENHFAWVIVDHASSSPSELALSVALARDAVESTGALNFNNLDTYAVALTKSGDEKEAARVEKRVIAVCDAVEGQCSEERARAKKLLARVP